MGYGLAPTVRAAGTTARTALALALAGVLLLAPRAHGEGAGDAGGGGAAGAGASAGSGSEDHLTSQERKVPLTEDAPVALRCAFTGGTWCTDFHAQQPVTWRPAPRGATECPDKCNGVGRCNYDTGYCDCPAGWKGVGCKTPQKRPCTHGIRHPDDKSEEPLSHIGPDKRDLDWTQPGWTYSRCAGICDDDLGICYCDGPMGRIPAPPDAPPGTPPIKRGRPLITGHNAPKTTWDGRKVPWGERTYEEVYGPKGYCNATQPDFVALCGPDDVGGPTCDETLEAFCPGQCSGHGYCWLGFCRCDEGYYGHDCARRKAGLPLLPSAIPDRPWLAANVREPPAALEPPPASTRLRPLIYVYDLEPLYQAKMLQYRVSQDWCVHRRHTGGNATFWTDHWVYAVDTLLHELLLMSEHRTFDPEEADFFYVPHYASCFPFPIASWADYPWFPGPGGPRVSQMVNIVLDAVKWINATYPYFSRRGGRDHVFLFTHDEGACWAPNAINASIWFTHWGRMGEHTSGTAFMADSYTQDFKNWRMPDGYVHLIEGHPCYNPEKDLVVPAFKAPAHYNKSPLQGGVSPPRDILLLFKGDVGKHRLAHYSRGVRQKVYQMAKAGDWKAKHNVLVGDRQDIEGDYSALLARSKYCLVAAGDGWSARMEDAVLHGCVPVVIIDDVHVPLESALNLEAFSVRLKQEEVPAILDILLGIPEKRLRAKQAHLGQVWHRYRYAVLPGLRQGLLDSMQHNEARAKELDLKPHAGNQAGAAAGAGAGAGAQQHLLFPRPFKGDPRVDDAFATILQWLYSRIPYARGEKQ